MPAEQVAEGEEKPVSEDEEESLLEIESDPPVYPENVDVSEQRRAFVVEVMASADIDGMVLVSNMDAVCKWLESGEVPAPPEPKRKAHLKSINND